LPPVGKLKNQKEGANKVRNLKGSAEHILEMMEPGDPTVS